jgi:DNA transformation protein
MAGCARFSAFTHDAPKRAQQTMMSPLIQSYLDLLAPLGGVSARRMFGGHGFYKDGVMFALEAFNRLFIKADDLNRDRFTEAGCEPFTYTYKDGREMVMSYYEPPEATFANEQRMKSWALLGWEAALRGVKPKTKKKATARKKTRTPRKGR